MIVYICASLDTKLNEALYLKNLLESLNVKNVLVDIGTMKESPKEADISNVEILSRISEKLTPDKNRNESAIIMEKALKNLINTSYQDGIISGVISFGGSGAASLVSAAVRDLPFGFPKIIVTTVACGNTSPYLLGDDIILINPIVDIQNLNFLTKRSLETSALLISSMIKQKPITKDKNKKSIAISSFGVTTPCVNFCADFFEKLGYEVLIFHARGASGGRLMEKMISEKYFDGVLDITTTEIIDEVADGIYSVGENRLYTASKMNIPYVVVPGALEMINLSTWDTLTEYQKQRTLYKHSLSSIKMLANEEEMSKAADIFADRLAASKDNACIIIPKLGFSSVNIKGKIFFNENTNKAFIDKISNILPKHIQLEKYDLHINDDEFANIISEKLLSLINK